VKISDRLADYVVIGGFFWITQCAVFFALGFRYLAAKPGNFQALIATVPDKAIAPLAALLGAIGLVAVLTTGVFIDLLSSSFSRSVEAAVFQKHAKKNASWMQQFTSRYESYIQEDWSAVLDAPVTFRDIARFALKPYIFWSRKGRAEVADFRKRMIAGRRLFMRMHSFPSFLDITCWRS